MKTFNYLLSWGLVRPRRWFFGRMIAASYPRWTFSRCDYVGWQCPNIHWWVLYKTIFKFCRWLSYEAWRHFCKWGPRRRESFPIIARAIKRLGDTTAGYAISGGECYHCASPEGCQVELSNDESGAKFVLIKAYTIGTQNGTDHRFEGVTICPKCGFSQEYEDGSL